MPPTCSRGAGREAMALQRDAAEKLVAFVVTSLRDRLEQVGRLDVLGGVGTEVSGYYESVAPLGKGADLGVLDRRASAAETLAGGRGGEARASRGAGAVRVGRGHMRHELVAREGGAARRDGRGRAARAPREVRAQRAVRVGCRSAGGARGRDRLRDRRRRTRQYAGPRPRGPRARRAGSRAPEEGRPHGGHGRGDSRDRGSPPPAGPRGKYSRRATRDGRRARRGDGDRPERGALRVAESRRGGRRPGAARGPRRPDDAQDRLALSKAYELRVLPQGRQPARPRARRRRARARTIREALAQRDPSNSEWQRLLGQSYDTPLLDSAARRPLGGRRRQLPSRASPSSSVSLRRRRTPPGSTTTCCSPTSAWDGSTSTTIASPRRRPRSRRRSPSRSASRRPTIPSCPVSPTRTA